MERRRSPLSCPVCTLYMREGVTLQTHLNTHPKCQLIAALVKVTANELRSKLTNTCECSLSATASSQELPVVGPSTPVPAQFPQPSSSHFPTDITYQHFLSSNGVPQYVPIPAVLTETGPSPACTNQAAFMQMVHNPYIMHQQQQQMQLLNSISPPPHQQSYLHHVLTPAPGLFSASNINPHDNGYMLSEYQEHRDNPDISPENFEETSGSCSAHVENSEPSNFVNAEPADAYTIFNVDGLQTAVPDGLVQASSSLIITQNQTIGVAETLQSTERCEATFSSQPVLNIHTDETVPPKGGLSEQESVGGNDSFMWAQAFTEASTLCDLLARESWETSDGSDVDVQVDSDSLPPEHNQETMCVLPLKLQMKHSPKQSKVYTCDVCNLNFNCPKERRVHQSTSHGNVGEENGETSMETEEKERFKCPVNTKENEHCAEKEKSSISEPLTDGEEKRKLIEDTSVSTVVKISKAKHTNKRDTIHGYLCSKCPQFFTSLKSLTAHECDVHQITKDLRNVCRTCNEAFENYSRFREHLQIHPLECPKCGKCFSRRQNLDLHVRRHLVIKPHMCYICDKTFVTKQKMLEHRNTHWTFSH